MQINIQFGHLSLAIIWLSWHLQFQASRPFHLQVSPLVGTGINLIVKALQFLKCLIHDDLMFCADPSTSLDYDLDEDEDILTYGNVPNTEESWDELWLEEEDDAIMNG